MIKKNLINNIKTEIDDKLYSGLTSHQAKHNLNKYGANELLSKKNKKWWVIFLLTFWSPLPVILLIAGIVSIIVTKLLNNSNNFIEFYVIIAIVIINAILETTQVVKAQKRTHALKSIVYEQTTVRRNNKIIVIPSNEITIKDVVILEAGSRIPAEILIKECQQLQVNESSLTGESNLILKKNYNKEKEITTSNLLFMGTNIINGRAVGVVYGIGSDTNIGEISKLITSQKTKKTLLQKNLKILTHWISLIALLVAVLMFLLLYFSHSKTEQNSRLSEYLLVSITLAIATIPESLPVIISIILSISAYQLSRKKVIIQNNQAIETLGAVSVICSDKTGTLTQNKMKIIKYNITNNFKTIVDSKTYLNDPSIFHFVNCLTLCNDAIFSNKKWIGDPTEIALVDWVKNNQIDITKIKKQFKRISEIPFNSKSKTMTTLNKKNKENILYLKGAVEQIIEKSNKIYLNNGIGFFSKELKLKITNQTITLAKKGLRILGLCYQTQISSKIDAKNLNTIFLGFVCLEDPLRDDSKQAVNKFYEAGIKIVMITGDHPDTALNIGKQLNIANNNDQVMTGDELQNLTSDQLNSKIMNYSIFARVSPADKSKIISAYQYQQNVVSMTGDGVNDAPSLVKANVGIAMGKSGTDVAKEAADLIILDDKFSTIVSGITTGRQVYKKIKQSITFVLASNFAEVLAFILVVLISKEPLIGAVNVLWFNLIVETLVAIPLGLSLDDDKIIKEKPRNMKETFFKKTLVCIFVIAFVFGAAISGGYYVMEQFSIDYKSTVAFVVLIFGPLSYVFAICYWFNNVKQQNKYLYISILIAICLNLIIVCTPTLNNKIFNIKHVNYQSVLIGIFFSLIPAILSFSFFYYYKKWSLRNEKNKNNLTKNQL